MKKQILKDCILNENSNAESILKSYVLSLDDFVDLIAKKSYNLLDLGVTKARRTSLIKKLFPEKDPNVRVHTYLLSTAGLGECSNCEEILDLDCFHSNSTRSKVSWCKYCQKDYNKEYFSERPGYGAARNAARRARLLEAIPPWANLIKIQEIYTDCPQGYEVDHIYPLLGCNTCGLHVEDNLQYLSPTDNRRKSNKLMEGAAEVANQV